MEHIITAARSAKLDCAVDHSVQKIPVDSHQGLGATTDGSDKARAATTE